MKLGLLIGAAVGYVLGARAGRERYEAIVRTAHKIAGSQTIQSTAGVLQGQVDSVAHRVRGSLVSKLHASRPVEPLTNGYHR
jgi:hypothetical protein